jgi:hypothetical protein
MALSMMAVLLLSAQRLDQNQWIRLLQIFCVRLVLEVFGSAGAIWGLSEAVGLRSSQSAWFWRPVALSVGMIFLVRWIGQIQDYIQSEASSCTPTEKKTVKKTIDEIQELVPTKETARYGSS